MAICPVRRQCPRFQATGYSRSRAVHDQGPRGYPVSEVEPMTLRSVLVSTDGPFTLSLLAFTVTLSLGRPQGSCGHPQGWNTRFRVKSSSTHPLTRKQREREEEGDS